MITMLLTGFIVIIEVILGTIFKGISLLWHYRYVIFGIIFVLAIAMWIPSAKKRKEKRIALKKEEEQQQKALEQEQISNPKKATLIEKKLELEETKKKLEICKINLKAGRQANGTMVATFLSVLAFLWMAKWIYDDSICLYGFEVVPALLIAVLALSCIFFLLGFFISLKSKLHLSKTEKEYSRLNSKIDVLKNEIRELGGSV